MSENPRNRYCHASERIIMGRNCLNEIVKASPERIVKVYTAKAEGSDPVLGLLAEKGVKVKFTSKRELFHITGSDSHQSFAAVVRERSSVDLADLLREDPEGDAPFLVLMLDSIADPQNLGALLRAAECFGVRAVVWSKNRGASLTPVVAKASVGASEIVDMIVVSNLAETVKKFQRNGYRVVVADVADDALPLSSYKFASKTLLVMGSEGKGVQPLICRYADDTVCIPMRGRIDSLNVSQATAVLLSCWSLNP